VQHVATRWQLWVEELELEESLGIAVLFQISQQTKLVQSAKRAGDVGAQRLSAILEILGGEGRPANTVGEDQSAVAGRRLARR